MGEMDDEFAKVNIQTSGLYNSFIELGYTMMNTWQPINQPY